MINSSQSTSSIAPNSSSTNLNIGLQINLTHYFLKKEEIVVKMGAHVEAFRAQREYSKKKALESKLDLESSIAWPEKRYCMCGDYSQNLDLPHFGGEQPGDTYYFSPYNISLFGLVNHVNEIMSAYSYLEGVGKKEGNNVVSLCYEYLFDNRSFLQPLGCKGGKNVGCQKLIAIVVTTVVLVRSGCDNGCLELKSSIGRREVVVGFDTMWLVRQIVWLWLLIGGASG